MALRVDLNGSGSGFAQMLSQARTQVQAFNNSVTSEVGSSWAGVGRQIAGALAGLATFQGLKSGLDWFVNTGKEIKEMSEQADVSTDSWQRWKKAAEDAGLAGDGLVRVMEALRQKRAEAQTDPKARGELSRLGFSDADITGKMGTDELMQRSLANANGGDTQRKYLADIIGTRGLKYASTLDYFKNETPDFSKRDIKEADKGAEAERKIDRATGTGTIGLARYFTGDEAYQHKVIGFWSAAFQKIFTGRGVLWDKGFTASGHAEERYRQYGGDYEPVHAIRSEQTNAGPETQGSTTTPGKSSKSKEAESDPMDAILGRQKEEMAQHNQERQEQLVDSERGIMTIGDRRESIRKEWGDLGKQIAGRKANDKGEGFLTDADKKDLEGVTGKAREYKVNELRQKYDDETVKLQVRQNHLQSELKEKPLNFQADSMSKVGLYSASAVAFNPLLGIAQRQLTGIEKIVANTNAWAAHVMKDRFAP